MSRLTAILATLALLALVAPWSAPARADDPAVAPEHVPVAKPAGEGPSLHDAMRGLWSDHVVWTRQFIVSTLADLPDKDAATQRLMKNQDDLGNAIKPIFGEPAGAKLTALLKDHIKVAADLVGALKAEDTAKAEAAKKAWAANADEIAKFLSDANPKAWPLADAKSMMHEHLDVTAQEVQARLAGDWEADVAAFEKVQEQAMRMADMLSSGVERRPVH